MLHPKELRRHKELAELDSCITEVMRTCMQEKKSAQQVCAVLSQMLDSYQYGRIKQEMDKQEMIDMIDDDPHLFI
jgi:hypothetical protein